MNHDQLDGELRNAVELTKTDGSQLATHGSIAGEHGSGTSTTLLVVTPKNAGPASVKLNTLLDRLGKFATGIGCRFTPHGYLTIARKAGKQPFELGLKLPDFATPAYDELRDTL